MIQHAPDHIVEAGSDWYPAVHDATRASAKDLGISTERAAGIVSSVSPNMDFDKRNFSALSNIANMNDSHWAMIERDYRRQTALRSSKDEGSWGRSDEVKAMLSEVVPGINQASNAALLRARHFLVNPDATIANTLDRRTAPKTHDFAQTILNPDHPWAVVDGRMSDIAVNQMRPWKQDRGISSADLTKNYRTTRYEDQSRSINRAGQIMAFQDPQRFGHLTPSSAQAIAWEMAKHVEKSFPTASGEDRNQGPERKGQRYLVSGRPVHGI